MWPPCHKPPPPQPSPNKGSHAKGEHYTISCMTDNHGQYKGNGLTFTSEHEIGISFSFILFLTNIFWICFLQPHQVNTYYASVSLANIINISFNPCMHKMFRIREHYLLCRCECRERVDVCLLAVHTRI